MTNEEVINELNLMEMVVRTSKATEAVKIATSALRAQQQNLSKVSQGFSQGQDNDPLTLDELREMEGEPVWVSFLPNRYGRWDVIAYSNSEFLRTYRSGFLLLEEYGKTWLTYRYKPEEGTR